MCGVEWQKSQKVLFKARPLSTWSYCLSCHPEFFLHSWIFLCVWETLHHQVPGHSGGLVAGGACSQLTGAAWLSCGWWAMEAAASAVNKVSLATPRRSPSRRHPRVGYAGAAVSVVANYSRSPSVRACAATSTATCPSRACTHCGRALGNRPRWRDSGRCEPQPSSRTWRTSWGPMAWPCRSVCPIRLAWGTGKEPEAECEKTFKSHCCWKWMILLCSTVSQVILVSSQKNFLSLYSCPKTTVNQDPFV